MNRHSSTRRVSTGTLVAVGAAAALALTAPLGSAGAESAPEREAEWPQDITDRVTDDATWEHMEAIYDIALENDGHRAAGTPGYAATIDYVEAQLQEVGYETWRQPVPFTYTEVLSNELTQLTPAEQDLENNVITGSPGTDGEVTAELAVPEVALGCTAADWAGADLTGQVALVQRGECPFSDKSVVAGGLGADAVLIYNNEPGPLVSASMGETLPEHVATTGISGDDGAALLADLADGPVEVRLNFDILVEERTDDNLFAETPSGDPDNLIVLGAHADGVPEGPGMHDNASGTSAVLEIARQMHDEPVRNKVRFAFWSVEEIGLIGSYHYVENLSAEELEQHKATVNLDMVAPLDHQNTLGVMDDIGSSQMVKVLTDQLDRDEHPWQTGSAGANSDHWPFVEAGIPATGIIAQSDDNYHTADDDLDNVSPTSLGNSARAAGQLTVALGNDITLAEDRPEPSVSRVSGADRYATATALAASAGDTDRVYLTSGQNYPDALAVAPVAAEQDRAVLLTRPDKLSDATAATLTELGTSEVVIVGGPGAVDDAVEAEVEALGIDVTRVLGDNRYGTAAELASLDRDRAVDTVFITTGADYPDALSIGSLAGATRDPVLLTRPDVLPAVTQQALTDLDPRRIVVVGGPGSVEPQVFEALAAIAPTERLAGDDRYGTAAAISTQFVDHGVAYLVSGADFADTLATSAIAGSHPAPLLLTDPAELSPATAAALEARAPHTVVVVGGSEAVDQSVLDEVEDLIGTTPQVAADTAEVGESSLVTQ